MARQRIVNPSKIILIPEHYEDDMDAVESEFLPNEDIVDTVQAYGESLDDVEFYYGNRYMGDINFQRPNTVDRLIASHNYHYKVDAQTKIKELNDNILDDIFLDNFIAWNSV